MIRISLFRNSGTNKSYTNNGMPVITLNIYSDRA
jgi:hypothetical protein